MRRADRGGVEARRGAETLARIAEQKEVLGELLSLCFSLWTTWLFMFSIISRAIDVLLKLRS